MKKSDKKSHGEKLDKSIDLAEKVGNTNVADKQMKKWKDSTTQIETLIYNANGEEIEIDSELVKQRTGKYGIKLLADDSTKPGLYTMKTVLNVNGQEYVTENEFAWGLVSLNSYKSIYKPNQTAEFDIVVLNSTGNPVCDSNIAMNITDPANSTSIFTTDDNIIPNEDRCGVYNLDYPDTALEGNYTIGIQAQTQTGIASFSTFFMVLEDYDYDVIRHTPSVIDPYNEVNYYHVGTDITSFVGNGTLTVRDYVPSFFNVTVIDGTVTTVGDDKEITWEVTPVNGEASLEYYYSVPLETPQLYTLGKAQIDQEGVPTFTEARPWYIAVDPQFLIDSFGENDGDQHSTSGKRSWRRCRVCRNY
jgi:hypothetical protein